MSFRCLEQVVRKFLQYNTASGITTSIRSSDIEGSLRTWNNSVIAIRNALTHSDQHGKAKMVDVSDKVPTKREATASAIVSLQQDTFKLVQDNQLKKGDVLSVATLAGIMGAKECHRLIPLCHHVPLSNVKLNLSLNEESNAVNIEGTAISVGQTGVEMEALTAVSIAALTIYDMCKGVSQNIVIGDIQLLEKKGGKSGHYRKSASSAT